MNSADINNYIKHLESDLAQRDKSIANLLDQLEEAQVDVDHLTQTMDGWVQQRDELVDDLHRQLEKAMGKPAESKPDIRDRIIELIAPAIEWKEQFYVNGEYEELTTLYRTYKPKKEEETYE